MNCENVNLKKLVKKAEKFDELQKDLWNWKEKYEEREAYWEKQVKYYSDKFDGVCDFFQQSSEGKYCNLGSHNLVEELPKILRVIGDEKIQGFLLTEERRDNNKRFKEELDRLQKEYEHKAEELDFAWQKFRAVKTSRLQQTINEINAEKI
jgi:hypothetical protein